MTRIALIALACLLAFGTGTAAAAGCPGATSCPWNSVSTFPASVSGLKDASDVAVDPADGDIYIVERDLNRVVRYEDGDTATPAKRQVWGARAGTGDSGQGFGEFEMPQGVAVDSAGNVWVTEINGNRLQKFDENGNFLMALGGTQGSANGQFVFPSDVAVDSSGNIYVADTGNSRIQSFTADGTFRWKVGTSGSGDGEFGFAGPGGIATDGAVVWATDGSRIESFSASTGAFTGEDAPPSLGGLANGIDMLGGDLFVSDSAGTVHKLAGGTWTSHSFSGNTRLTGIDAATLGGTDYVFTSDRANAHVERMTTAFGAPTDIALPGNEQLFRPTAVAPDASGNVWVVEGDSQEGYHRVLEYDSSGALINRFGANGGDGSSGNALGEFNDPIDVAVAGTNVYIADASNNRIQRYDGSSWTLVPAPVGGFSFPSGLGVDGAGNLYVTDASSGASKVWKYDGATWTDLALPDQADGDFAEDVAVDATGAVYVAVANSTDSRVLKRDGAGIWQASALATQGSGDGQLNYPRALAVAGTHLFVADTNNNRIQRLSTSGAFEAKWGSGQFPVLCAGEVVDPEGIGLSADGNQVYVASRLGYSVSKYSFDGSPAVPACDTTPPAVTLSSPANNATGVSSTPSFSGSADESTTVTVRVLQRTGAGLAEVRKLTGTASGGSFTVAWSGAPLGDGEYWAKASQSDAAGNTGHSDVGSANWGAQRFSIGSAATPTVTMSSFGPATKDTTPNLGGTATNNSGDDSTVFVKIYQGSSVPGGNPSPFRFLSGSRTGTTWSLADSAYSGPGALPDGVYTARAQQANPSATPTNGFSSDRTFEVDTTAPVVNLANPVDNSTTASKRPAISGTAGNKGGLSADTDLTFELSKQTSGGFVHVNEGAVQNGFFTVAKPTSGTSFSTTIPVDLSSGTYHLRAYQDDQAGNSNPQDTGTSRLFTVTAPDTTPPALTITRPGRDGIVNSGTVTLSGAAGDASGDGTEITVLLDRLVNGNYEPSGSTHVTRTAGSWSVQWPSTLSDGGWRVRAHQSDSSGNTKDVDTTFTVDTQAPTLALSTPTDKGHYPQGTRVVLRGSSSKGGGERPTVRVELSFDEPGKGFVQRNPPSGNLTGTRYDDGSWSIDLGTLPAGHWFARIYLDDAAGNSGNVPVQWYIDPTPPNRPPDIQIRRPTPDQHFVKGYAIASDYDCSDPDAGDSVALCQAPSLLDTSSVGEKRFTVTARDQHGAERTTWSRYWVDPPPASEGIRVQGIEFMQATQTAGVEPPTATVKRSELPFRIQSAEYQGVSVVKNKSALARVYVDAPSRDIDVYLYGYQGDRGKRGKLMGVLRPARPWDGAVIDKSRDGVGVKQRKALGGYGFLIPAEWTSSSFDLVAVAVPSTSPSPEACFDCSDNNGFTLTNVVVSPSRGWHFGMVEFRYKGSTKDPPSLEDHLLSAIDILPVPDGSITIDANYRAVLTVPEVAQKDVNEKLLDALWAWDQKQGDDGNSSDFTLGNAPLKTDAGIETDGPIFTKKTCGFLGLGCTWHRPVAMTVADARPRTGTTHEIEHGLGRDHASKCGGGEVGGYESWPPDQQGYLQGVGMSRRALEQGEYRLFDGLSPNPTAYDNMSYCADVSGGDPNAWISPKGWAEVLSRLRGGIGYSPRTLSADVGAQAAATGDTLAVRGFVQPDGTVVITGVGKGGYGAGPESSPYRVIARNASGAPLANVPLVVSTGHVNLGPHYARVFGTIPAAAAESLVIVQGTRILGTATRSKHAPEVRVVAPKKGQKVGGGKSVRISWKASDADGGALTGTVDYTVNGGRTWRTIASGETDGNIDVPSGTMFAGKRARVRVTVSDGWNETSATSGVFRSEGAPPKVMILSPTENTRQNNDATLQLTGIGADDRGEKLRDRNLRWYVGDRRVARGSSAAVTGLPPGRRTLRLEGTDRLGRRASATVKIRLKAAEPRLFGLKTPRKVSRRARRVSFRAASTIPGTLRVGKRHFALGLKPRRVTVPVKPGHKRLTLQLVLRAYGKSSKTILSLKRG